MEATAADWTTAIFTAALAFLTLVLAVATGYYAKQTRRMVEEMEASRAEARRGREQSIRPKLALTLVYRTEPELPYVAVKNVGSGAALEADLTLAFDPGAKGKQTREVRPWRENLIGPGDEHWFLSPRAAADGTLEADDLAAAFERIELTGKVQDALGTTHEVDERFDDLPGYRQRRNAVGHTFQEDETARAALKTIAQELSELRKAINEPLCPRS
jgi:hypothetical protein